jgi:hypothetical protein
VSYTNPSDNETSGHETQKRDRNLGSETEIAMSGSKASRRIKKHSERAARLVRWVALLAFVVAMIGFGGVGYCDRKARFSPAVPDPALGYTNGVNFKGTTRYVTALDSRICAISFPISFSGMAAFILIGGFYFYIKRV